MHPLRRAALAAALALVPLLAACEASDAGAAAELAAGRTLFATNGCAPCHGVDGRGDGPLARTLLPRPRDFRQADAFKNGSGIDEVARTLATGLTRDGGQMQSYGHLSERERRALARYVISLRK